MKLEEKQIATKQVYNGKIICVHEDTVELPNKKLAKREVVYHPGGVGILAFHENKIALVKQYRYPYQKNLYEIPAGKIEANEPILETAKRELKEEVGMAEAELTYLGYFYPSPGYFNEIIHLYLAENGIVHANQLDQDEFLELIWIDFQDVKEKIRKGEIVDAKTIIAIYYYNQKVNCIL